jgi:uncharacterized OB-fold protein
MIDAFWSDGTAGYRIMRDLATEVEGIVCLSCGSVSFNPGDIVHLYCAACHKYHEPSSPPSTERKT